MLSIDKPMIYEVNKELLTFLKTHDYIYTVFTTKYNNDLNRYNLDNSSSDKPDQHTYINIIDNELKMLDSIINLLTEQLKYIT